MVPEKMSDTKKLGFGLMRLPKKGLGIDIEQTKQMVDMFMNAGFTYFDTAFVYPGSEDAAKKALIDRYPRDSFTLATKLNAAITPTVKMAHNQFETSLKRTGAGYFDYYLLHALQENNFKKYEKLDLWNFVKEQKAAGRIKHIGFSFHGGPKLLDELLTEHPDVDFVQLQLNYADWENPSVTSRANYEIARKHDKLITVMEPVKGGSLAKPPKEVRKMMKDYAPDASFASWAIRFVASLDGILTVLSGMSNVEQMENNLSYMKDFKPLNADEQQIIQKAQRIIGHSGTIACTACHYCTDGCPKQIPIPEIFSAMNLKLGNGQDDQAGKEYERVTSEGHRASDCIRCGKCEATCPQHLKIRDYLEQCADTLE